MHEDVIAAIDALRRGMVPGRSIAEIEKEWDHFRRLELHFELFPTDDRTIINALRRLKDGLGQFTSDVRNEMPSPYSGFGVELTTLGSYLLGGHGKDGWPKKDASFIPR